MSSSIFLEVLKAVPCKLAFHGLREWFRRDSQHRACQGSAKDVFFLGNCREIDPYVASADLFLLPSEQESFGLSALEAMAYGIPVVATNVGGLPELIEHGKSGFLAPVGDINKMAEYSVKLLKDDRLYQTISKASLQRAQENFCACKIVSQYEAFYKKILDETTASVC